MLGIQLLDLDTAGKGAYCIGTSREQEMPFPTSGEKLPRHGQVVCIINDQQPPFVFGEPSFCREGSPQLTNLNNSSNISLLCEQRKQGCFVQEK